MRHVVSRVLLPLLLLSGAPALADEPNILLATKASPEVASHDATFRRVVQHAIDALEDFEVSWIRPGLDWSDPDKKQQMLSSAASSRLPIVALANLTVSEQRRGLSRTSTARLQLEFVNSVGGEVTLARQLEFEFNTLDGLMAQIEYELTRNLKRHYGELGQVVRVSDQRIWFDLGRNAGVRVGDVYRVYGQGEALETSSGDRYGFLDEHAGIVVVREVTNVYAVADILLGQRSIEADHWVEQVDGQAEDYQGRILTKLNDEVAISLGHRAGISRGDEFAVYKDLENIGDDDAFRVEVARIRITSVHENHARGQIMRSDRYDLARGLVEPGDTVQEVRRRGDVMVNFGYNSLGLTNDDITHAYTLGLRFESQQNLDAYYRITMGYLDTAYFAVGLMGAVNRSESFFYGVDAVWTDSLGTNLLMSVNAPTPFQEHIRLNTEVGYLVSEDDSINGLNISVGLTLRSTGNQ
ncbi:hypothetical protein E4656_18480 [Natronospirillum operosum]|uniref:DUF481 domain-containing protein n=1 Tax=Natronospirillum operosum TaxID=2759953 RepID=A0A4Z0W778_9GAMM|nr:hypothetical protein [Natronospirillum operosum]TGG90389.1 hypothetical protein E4656_18480 [Natronospirillum operosum]